MSRVLLDWRFAEKHDKQVSVEIEQIDVDRGFMKIPTEIFGVQELKLHKLRVGDVLHVPTPYRREK